MSNKGTNKQLSYAQYRTADLLIFLLIMCVCEAINVFAVSSWFQGMTFTVSVMLLVSLIVFIRWGWWGVIFPFADGLLYCWMNGAIAEQYIIYCIGNSFLALIPLIFLVVPKKKWMSSWFMALLYSAIGYILVVAGRVIICLCYGYNFAYSLTENLTFESLNVAFAFFGILILRMINGMMVDQKTYLTELYKGNKVRPAEEDKWEGYTELDDEDLKDLAEMDDYDAKLFRNDRAADRLKRLSGEEDDEPQ